MKEYYKNTERVRLLRDTKGSGKADSSVVFADAADQYGIDMTAMQPQTLDALNKVLPNQLQMLLLKLKILSWLLLLRRAKLVKH